MAPNVDGSQVHTVIAVSIIFAILTFFVLILRLSARYYVLRMIGLVDFLMIGACLLSWAFITTTILAAKHGLGEHIEVVLARGPANFKSYLQIVWLSSIFYNACLGLIKLSVLTLYSRLGDASLRRAALVMIAIVACQCLANVFTCAFQCSPIAGAWDLSIKNKKCINIDDFYLANAALNITTDLITYFLPIRLVYGLPLPNKQKIAMYVTFGLGFFACLSSIIRIAFIPALLISSDPTWAITQAMYWSVIETNIGILATSIPSFKAIAKRYMPRFIGESSVRGSNGGGGWNSNLSTKVSDAVTGKGGCRPFSTIQEQEQEQPTKLVDLSSRPHHQHTRHESGSADLTHMGHQPPPVVTDSEYRRDRALSGLQKHPISEETEMTWEEPPRTSEESFIKQLSKMATEV